MAQPREWFEMRNPRRRSLDSAVWVPLCAAHTVETVGCPGYCGHREEYFGATSLAVPLACRDEVVETLSWNNAVHDHAPFVEAGRYVPADRYEDYDGNVLGTHLVMQNRAPGPEPKEWVIHPDLILGFRLIREGDIWLSPRDGYEEAMKLTRSPDGTPGCLLMRTEYVKDFLAAREMALYVLSYRSRLEVIDEPRFDGWTGGEDETDDTKWNCRISPVHPGGLSYGERWAVVHTAHAGVDDGADVPVLPHPSEGKFESASYELVAEGEKLHRVSAQLWRNEWVEPGQRSPRIRGDAEPSRASFIVDGEGTRRKAKTLKESGRWLWFRPDVILALAHRRGGSLEWHTRDTASVSCVPGGAVWFGVNPLGLINVYAKDIAYLPNWQQDIWTGANVGPDGGVSEELRQAQILAKPASTQAPEAFLGPGLEALREASLRGYGHAFVRQHVQAATILKKVHRFRAVDRDGLFALAKDLARLTADLFDEKAMNDSLGLKGSARVRSLAAMEAIAAAQIGADRARALMAPLRGGICELRHGDAHLPSEGLDEAFRLAHVSQEEPLVIQGYQLIHSCVTVLYDLLRVIAGDDSEGDESDTS